MKYKKTDLKEIQGYYKALQEEVEENFNKLNEEVEAKFDTFSVNNQEHSKRIGSHDIRLQGLSNRVSNVEKMSIFEDHIADLRGRIKYVAERQDTQAERINDCEFSTNDVQKQTQEVRQDLNGRADSHLKRIEYLEKEVGENKNRIHTDNARMAYSEREIENLIKRVYRLEKNSYSNLQQWYEVSSPYTKPNPTPIDPFLNKRVYDRFQGVDMAEGKDTTEFNVVSMAEAKDGSVLFVNDSEKNVRFTDYQIRGKSVPKEVYDRFHEVREEASANKLEVERLQNLYDNADSQFWKLNEVHQETLKALNKKTLDIIYKGKKFQEWEKDNHELRRDRDIIEKHYHRVCREDTDLKRDLQKSKDSIEELSQQINQLTKNRDYWRDQQEYEAKEHRKTLSRNEELSVENRKLNKNIEHKERLLKEKENVIFDLTENLRTSLIHPWLEKVEKLEKENLKLKTYIDGSDLKKLHSEIEGLKKDRDDQVNRKRVAESWKNTYKEEVAALKRQIAALKEALDAYKDNN